MNKTYYYDIREDLEKCPDCWAYFVWSGRNTGKTYSALRYMVETDSRFVFVKRTVEDVNFLLSGSGKVGTKLSQYGADVSPFVAINRDFGTNIKPFGIYKGYLGGFWKCNEKNEPILSPIGYIVSLSAISKIKGFDLSECDYIIFDEFIPQPWERVDKQEGKQLLDLYMTVSRDREHRGRGPLKLLCLANPTDVNCPIFQELEIADDAVSMTRRNEEYLIVRNMCLHEIKMREDFLHVESEMSAIKSMENTAWHSMTMGDGFAYNDFGSIGPQALKGFRCLCEIRYRRARWFLYQKDSMYYVCKSPGRYNNGLYDLNTDKDARRFYLEMQIDLKHEYIDGNVKFQTYTMFDVLINFRKFFPFV